MSLTILYGTVFPNFPPCPTWRIPYNLFSAKYNLYKYILCTSTHVLHSVKSNIVRHILLSAHMYCIVLSVIFLYTHVLYKIKYSSRTDDLLLHVLLYCTVFYVFPP